MTAGWAAVLLIIMTVVLMVLAAGWLGAKLMDRVIWWLVSKPGDYVCPRCRNTGEIRSWTSGSYIGACECRHYNLNTRRPRL